MKFLSRLFLTKDEKRRLTTPILLVVIAVLVSILIHSLNPFVPPIEKKISLGISVGGILYSLLHYFVLVPFSNEHRSFHWLLALINGTLISIALGLEPFTSLRSLSLIFTIASITTTSIVSSRRYSYFLLGIVSASRIVFENPVWSVWDPGFWLEAMSYPIIGILITESILILKNTIYSQIRRMEILNNVAQSLASSLEIHQVIALLSSAIQNSLDADTYYVGLLEEDHKIRLDLFYDDGEFFPPRGVPLENTMAGWVIDNRSPLFLNNVLHDTKQMGIPFTIIGKQKVSKSWMGTLLEANGKVLGIVAVASYETSAFNYADFELIQNVAQQASMAIDNAYHHAEVEKQSTLDSLTGALNHGHFLKSLASEADSARMSGTNLSLIMLDIDHFKLYNDNYGHLIGDQVLFLLTEIIQKHIKSTDLVGRWGGEEFVIALPNTNGVQAFGVAQRIQLSMNALTLTDREDNPIPAPSVSQGIAVFPKETTSIYTLVDLADQRLYIAKERGRNQIDPLLSHWDKKILITE